MSSAHHPAATFHILLLNGVPYHSSQCYYTSRNTLLPSNHNHDVKPHHGHTNVVPYLLCVLCRKTSSLVSPIVTRYIFDLSAPPAKRRSNAIRRTYSQYEEAVIRQDLALFLARLLPSKCTVKDGWDLFRAFHQILVQLNELDLAKMIAQDNKPMDRISKATFYECSVSLWADLEIDVHNLRSCIIKDSRLNQVRNLKSAVHTTCC